MPGATKVGAFAATKGLLSYTVCMVVTVDFPSLSGGETVGTWFEVGLCFWEPCSNLTPNVKVLRHTTSGPGRVGKAGIENLAQTAALSRQTMRGRERRTQLRTAKAPARTIDWSCPLSGPTGLGNP